jgi:polyhydroxyalkanoate synthase
MTWASSDGAWRLSKHGSSSSNQNSPLADLLREIGAVDAQGFEQALRREVGRRMQRLADGILAYRGHAVHRDLENPPAVWSEGNTRLLDYGATNPAARARPARAVLVVPSLINRWEVLDLTAEKSLLRAMAAEGLRPYLVDWGTPDAGERKFDLAAYIARLERALAFVAKRARRSPAVMGYCMGGTMAVALTARQPRKVAKLALLAAPWDFHADKAGHAFLLSIGPMLADAADRIGELPVDILQTLFWSLDPWLAVKKFERFLRMDQQSGSAREFVLLEDWINGGAPLAGPVARECLVGWYGDNLPGTDKWEVDGKRIVPSKIARPSLVMIPSGDRIVPPLSASALADGKRGLKNVTRIDLPLGHIGMVVSGRARELCWTPLIDWLKTKQ